MKILRFQALGTAMEKYNALTEPTFDDLDAEIANAAEINRRAAYAEQIREKSEQAGSLLDSDGMAALEEMAADRDMQVWIECVSNDRNIGVCIEDGEVVAVDGEETQR